MDRPSQLQFSRTNSSFLLRIIDMTIIVLSLLVIMQGYKVAFDKDYLLVLVGILLLFSYISESFSLYRSWRLGKFSTMCRMLIAIIAICFLVMFTTLFLFKYAELYSRVVMMGWFVLSVVSSTLR